MQLLKHKGRRRVDKLRAARFLNETLFGAWYRFRAITEAQMAEQVRKIARHKVVEVDGSATEHELAAVPLADSHKGLHSLYRPWPLAAQLHKKKALETVLWDVVWHRDPREAKGPPQLLPAQPAVWAAAQQGVFVYGGNIYGCQYGFGGGGCLWELALPVVARRRVTAAFVVCDGNCNGYFHFTHEHLPRLATALESLLSLPQVAIVVTSFSVRFVREYIVDLLGVPPERIVAQHDPKTMQRGRAAAEGDAIFADTAIIAQPQACGNTHAHSLRVLRRIVFGRLSLPHAVPAPAAAGAAAAAGRTVRVLLAERAGRAGRMPDNWADIAAALQRRVGSAGAARVSVSSTSGNISVAGQVRLFNAADLVIGPHGANLANVIWMRSGASLLEFMSYVYGNLCYYTSAARVGVQHRFALHSARKGDSYNISPAEVVRHVDDVVLRATGAPPLVWE